jgi:hypothetical protein
MTNLHVPLPRPLDNTSRSWIAEHITDDAVTDAPSSSTNRATLEARRIEVTEAGQTVSVHIKHAAGVLDFDLLSPATISLVYTPREK